MNPSSPDSDEETHIVRGGISYAFIFKEEDFTLRRTDGEFVSVEEYEDLLAYLQEEGWGDPDSLETDENDRGAAPRDQHEEGLATLRLPPMPVPPSIQPREHLPRGRHNSRSFWNLLKHFLTTGNCRQTDKAP